VRLPKILRKEQTMLEGINGLNPANGNQDVKATTTAKQGKINSLFGKQSASRTQYQEDVTFNPDGSRTVKKNGKEITYKDINGDGKEEIYSVTTHYAAKKFHTEGLEDRPAEDETYIDEDGDGYDDVRIVKTYDENGKLISETKTYEKDINDVKSGKYGQVLPYMTENRKMSTHLSGLYIR